MVASPHPSTTTLAAAYVAGADCLLPIGGAHAIAALAYGTGPIEACDAVVGPGNVFVTAAKSLVAGSVAIDMLAGPLQARPRCSSSRTTPLTQGLSRRTFWRRRSTIRPRSPRSFARRTHFEIHVAEPMALKRRLKHYGGLFVGAGAAEVLGDYGAGPNHTLPTGGTARSSGGLCVMTFLRVRTWMRVDDATAAERMIEDAGMLADLEGLHGHAVAARRRLPANANANGQGAAKRARAGL